MNRRNIFRAIVAGAGGLFALGRAQAQDKSQDKPSAEPKRATKVAYHLSEFERVNFVLGNIRNHIDGTGGPGMIDIVLVVHGPALRAFKKQGVDAQISQRLATFSKAGVKLDACGNTMQGMQINLDDLLPGFTAAEEGGVVRLADLQAQGYAYLRP